MKLHEYKTLYQKSDANNFHEKVFPTLTNAYWSSNGESFYPCILLEDNATDEHVCIVKKNHSIMMTSKKSVIRMEESERAPYMQD